MLHAGLETVEVIQGYDQKPLKQAMQDVVLTDACLHSTMQTHLNNMLSMEGFIALWIGRGADQDTRHEAVQVLSVGSSGASVCISRYL